MEIHTSESDEERLLKEVKSAINNLGYVKLRSINCFCIGKTIRLEGKTDSYYNKQITLMAAQKVPGVEAVVDQIGVVGPN